MTDSGVARYRAGMAELLRASLAQTEHIEQGLGVSAGARELAEAAFQDEPTGVFRVMCAMLLRKARLHGIAVLRANDHSNAHSLGVQMRPVLECAGQVVLTFRNLMIETERAEETVGGYMNADFYQTVIRETKGGVGHDELLQRISEAGGNREDGSGRRGRLRHIDKVAMLQGGADWWRHLSRCFCHAGPGTLRGELWQGGVRSINTQRDVLTFGGLLDYLVEQVAVMNAHAVLCPNDAGAPFRQVDDALERLRHVRAAAAELREDVLRRRTAPDAGN